MPSTPPFFRSPRRTPVALALLLTFGCTVVRAPASSISTRIPVRDGVAEPQLELWLEAAAPASAADTEAAAAEGRRVLGMALSQRALDEGDQLLVVRAQGLTRTEGRRGEQDAAVGAIVVGVVVVAVVAILAATGGKGSKGHRGHATAPSFAGSAPRPAPPPGTLPRPPRISRAPRAHHHPGGISFNVGVLVPLAPEPPLEESTWQPGIAGGPPPPPPPYALPPPEPPPPPPDLAPEPPEGPLAELLLPPPEPMDFSERGFFGGDEVRVELLLVDRKTGAPLWRKVAAAKSDPLDVMKMKELLDAALDDPSGWEPAPEPAG